jgi:CHASE3 domain sensor protein
VAEVTRIFANGIRMGALPNEDVQYVGRVVAQRTDLTQQQAEQRVREVFMKMQTTLNDAETKAREAADAAREASAYAALWLFISLLAGAFVASWMATFGGRQRDL